MPLFSDDKGIPVEIPFKKGNIPSSGSDSPTSFTGTPIDVDDEFVGGGEAGFFASVFNLMNGILGCGIVGLPILVMNIGTIGFTVGLLSVAIFALWTIDLLLQICVKYKTTVYEDLATLAFGRPGRIYTSFVIALSCFIAQGAFLYIVKDNIVGILQGLFLTDEMGEATSWYLREENAWILTLIVIWGIVAPLTLPRQINFLGKSSGVAMIGMMVFAGMLIALKFKVEYPIHKSEMAVKFLYTWDQEKSYILDVDGNLDVDRKNECFENVTICGWSDGTRQFAKQLDYNFDFAGANISFPKAEDILTLDDEKFVTHSMRDVVSWFNGSNVYAAFPTMIFAFQCHASALPIYSEQNNPTRSNFLKVAITSITLVFLIYWASAIAAAHTFYNVTWNQVMLPYIAMEQSNILILIARITIVNCVTLSAPLLLYTGRKTLVMLFARPGSVYLKEIQSRDNYIKKHIGWAIVNLVAVSILVCTIQNVGIIFNIGGAVTANSIVVILPTAFYYKLMILKNPNSDVENSTEPLVTKKDKTSLGHWEKCLEMVSHYIYPFVTGAGITLMMVMVFKTIIGLV